MKNRETEEAAVSHGVPFPWQWCSNRGSYFIEHNLDNSNSKNSDNPLIFLVMSLGHFLGLCHGVSISFLSRLLVTYVQMVQMGNTMPEEDPNCIWFGLIYDAWEFSVFSEN